MNAEQPNRDEDLPSRFKYLTRQLPINKGPKDEDGNVRRLPQITNKATVAALGIARTAIKNVLGNVRPSWAPGRSERFRQRLLSTVRESPVASEIGKVLKTDIRVDVHESFGKPVLVSLDLLLPDPRRRLTEVRTLHLRESAERTAANRDLDLPAAQEEESPGVPGEEEDFDPHRDVDPALHVPHEQQLALAVLLADLLQRLVEEAWDNPEIAPVAVRGRVIAVHGNPAQAHEMVHTRKSINVPESETLVLDMRDLGFVDEIGRVEDLYERFGPPRSDPHWRP